MEKNISTIKSKNRNLTWINIVNASKKEINYLARKYKFNQVDLADSYARQYSQRPKYNLHNNYAFLILQFPVYDRKKKEIRAEEIDFFISKNYIITVHKNNLPPLVKLFNACASDAFYREQYMSDSSAYLLYEIILTLQEYVYPILDHISLDIENIENNIFSGLESQMIAEISLIKRNILNARKILEAHKNVIKKIAQERAGFLPVSKFQVYYSDLIEHTKNIWEILQNQKDLIVSFEDTNNALVSLRLNTIMKTLTIFSVIVFPLTLLAAIFGMNTINGMPFMESPNGFWIIIGIMAGGTVCMFLYFKNRKWI